MRLVIRWLINALALWVAALVLTGIDFGADWQALLITAAIFGVVNALVRPVLKALTCPLQILTLGLFTIVINALMLWLTSMLTDLIGYGQFLDRFWPTAVVGALIVSAVSIVASLILRDPDDKRRRRRRD